MTTSLFGAQRTLAVIALMAVACSAQAQSSIDQNKALAGGVTPGDAPGFPVTLTAAGAYRLTGNLVVPAGTDGILIAAPNVSIDLNGFSIVGPVVCSGAGAALACVGGTTGSGVTIYNGSYGASLRNGTVRGFGAHGVVLDRDATVERVTSSSNGGYGFSVYDNSVISDSMANDNGAAGMLLMSGGVVTGSRAHNNRADGFYVNDYDSGENRQMGGEVRDSYASRNGGSGFTAYGTPVSWINNAGSKNLNCFSGSGKLVRNNVCDGVAK